MHFRPLFFATVLCLALPGSFTHAAPAAMGEAAVDVLPPNCASLGIKFFGEQKFAALTKDGQFVARSATLPLPETYSIEDNSITKLYVEMQRDQWDRYPVLNITVAFAGLDEADRPVPQSLSAKVVRPRSGKRSQITGVVFNEIGAVEKQLSGPIVFLLQLSTGESVCQQRVIYEIEADAEGARSSDSKEDE